MKFEKLNDVKIRIILSDKDIQQNNLSIKSILSNSKNSQQFLEHIISQAEKKLDFKTEDSELLVEAIAPSNEECVFTITKLLTENIYNTQYNKTFIFKFKNFDDLLNLCIFLNNFSYLNLKSFSKNFSLIFYNYTYYLKLTHQKNSPIITDYLRTLFEEFGTNVSSDSIEGTLNEYGKILFPKNAIQRCLLSFTKKSRDHK